MIGSSSRTSSSSGTTRYAGVAAGPAEDGSTDGTSRDFLGQPGDTFDITVRVAGTLPSHDDDPAGTVRYCFRTVDDGYALCTPRPESEVLRPGAVLRIVGTITGHRTQGQNQVTEIDTTTIDHLG